MVAMKSALLKDTLREIKRTFSRFVSILSIVALGVGFYAGLKATCPDMKATADKYFDDCNLMDIRLLSTVGFNDDDIAAVKKVHGIKGIMPGYAIDALANIDQRDLVLKIMSLPRDMNDASSESFINRPTLVRGRYPEKPGECLAEGEKIVPTSLAIGSKIKLSSGTDTDIGESLNVNEFTVVGIAETPYYISYDRGTSSIGSGKINSFIMIPEQDFKIPAYTDIFLTVDNAKNRLCYDDEYRDVIDPVKDSVKNAAKARVRIRYQEILADADKELGDSKKQLSDAKERQRKELASARAALDSSARRIEDGKKKLKSNRDSFNSSVKAAQSRIDAGYEQLHQGEAEWGKKSTAFGNAKSAAQTQLVSAEQEIARSRSEIQQGEDNLNSLKSALAAGMYSSPEQKAQMEGTIKALELKLNDAVSQLQSAQDALSAKKEDLLNGEARLKAARKTLDDSRDRLDCRKKALQDSKQKALSQFAASEKKLADAETQLRQGEKKYSDSKSESDKKIAAANKKIASGEEAIAKIKEPKWYVLGRDTNPGFVDFGSSSEKIDAIAKVFPVFFFLVAALVCLTTMTRMVEEQRVNIGTLKALGYSKIAIASKYLLYAAAASITGSIIGLAIGYRLLPTVIYNAYRIMYIMPDMEPSFNVPYAICSTVFAVFTTTLAALFSCWETLAETPAQLMLPKAPKPGKRILLERIKPIWSRFNFSQKITARNLFRYKGRFLMTVIGVGGCTALLLTGFGLSNSIMSIVSKQFDELYRFDLSAGLEENLSDRGIAEIKNSLADEPLIAKYTLIAEKNVDVGAGKTTKEAALRVPENSSEINDFIVFRSRTSGKCVPFTEDGVCLTEKLAKMLNVKAGDRIYITGERDQRADVKVTGIIENYVYHYVYMSPKMYRAVFGSEPEYNEALAITADNGKGSEDSLSARLLKQQSIRSVSFTTGVSDKFKDTIHSLNYVVLVMIFSAGALAFVVLYNLTNINITERIREIATIKVLGFYDREVSSYVFRENMVLTFIGTVLGLVLGIFLHRFIIVTAEVDYVMFGRDIKPLSYVYAALLTVIFSLIVDFVMHFRLRRISMVESMKSVD